MTPGPRATWPRGLPGVRLPSYRAGLLVLLAIITVSLLGLVSYRYNTIEREAGALTDRHAGERAVAIASLLRDSIASTIRQADFIHDIAAQMTQARRSGNTPLEAVLQRFLDPSEVHLGPDVIQVGAIGTDGRPLWVNRDRSAPPVDLSDRPHFQAFQKNPALEFYFGAPLTGRLSNEATVQYARALRGADGSFKGVTVLSLRASMLARLCRDVELASEDSVTLLREDGTVLMRRDAVHLGETVADMTAIEHADPFTAAPGPIENVPRYMASQRIPGTGLTVLVGLSAAAQTEAQASSHGLVWRGSMFLDLAIILIALVGGSALLLLGRAAENAARAQSLMQSEAWFRSLSDDMVDGIVVCDGIEQGPPRISYVNSAGARMLGVPAETLVGRELESLLAPDDRDKADARIQAAIGQAKLGETSYRVLRPDDSILWVTVSSAISAVPTEPGRLRMITLFRDITAAKAREEAFEEARTRLARMLQVIPGVFYQVTMSPDGHARTTFVSESVQNLFGISVAEALGHRFLSERAMTDLTQTRLSAIEAAGPGGVAVAEYGVRLSGRELWVRDTLRLLPQADGSSDFIGFLVDATAAHAADLALQRLNWALAAYSSSLASLIRVESLHDVATRVCANIVAQPVYTLAIVSVPEEDDGQPLRLLASSGSAIGYLEGLRMSWSEQLPEGRGPAGTAVRSGKAQIIADTQTAPDYAPWRERAARHGIRSTVTLPCKRGAQVLGVIGIYASVPDAFGPDELEVFERLADEIGFAIALEQDRERLREAETARHKAEEGLRAAAQLGPGLLYRARVGAAKIEVMDVFGDVTRVTEDIEAGETPAATLSRLLSAPEPSAAMRAGLALSGVASGDHGVFAHDGKTRWIRNTVRANQHTEDGTEVIGYIAEVTREKTEQLYHQHVATLLTLGEMATGIAHELNQPLASISFAAQNAALLLGQPQPNVHAVAEKVRRIIEQAHRASHLIDHMRKLARNEQAETQAVAWRPVLEQALEIVASKLRGCEVLTDLPEHLPRVMGTPIAMEQILINLISNALDAYAAGAMPGPCRVMVTGFTAGEQVVMRVSDRAGGIPPEHLPRIFEPFFTTKASAQGTGLGLALVFASVTAMGGTITAANADGGAVFEVSLPVAP